MSKEKKRYIKIWIICFIVSLIVCSVFLKPHYTHDTYRIIRDGYSFYSYDKFLKESRPITAMITIFCDAIKAPIEIYMVISFIIAIALLSLSAVFIYKIFKEKIGSITRIKDIILMIMSYLIIFNYLAIEHIFFVEAGIMALGVLLSVFACRVIIDNEKYKYLKAFFILLIAVFCYQGSIAMFPIILLTYYAIIEPTKMKEYIKISIKVMLLYGFIMFLTVLYVRIFFYGGSRIQVGAIELSFKMIWEAFKELLFYSLHVIPKFIHMGVIIGTIIAIFTIKGKTIKEKIIYGLEYILIISAGIGICLMPVIVGSGLEIEPRMCLSFGCTIGVSLLFILDSIKNKEDKNWLNIITYSLTIAIFILNLSLYFIITHQHVKVNQLDREIGTNVKAIIDRYEEETGIKVRRLTATFDKNVKRYMKGFIQTKNYNQRATSWWGLRETIVYYTEHPMAFVPFDEEVYYKYFYDKDWDEFSEEQVVIIGDTLYFCAY